MVMRQRIFESNNKGLFDVAVGEGNISSDFATELQNARISVNGEVSKRRGRLFFNAKPIEWAAGSSIASYSDTNRDDQFIMRSAVHEQVGSAITLSGDEAIQYVSFSIDKVGSPTGTCSCVIYAATGVTGSNATPTGNVLARSIDVDVADFDGTFRMRDFTFEDPHSLTAGDYVFLLEYNGGDSSNHIRCGIDASSPTHANANLVSTNSKGSTWWADNSKDVIIDINKAGPEVLSLILFEGDFVDGYEVLAQADTRVMRYTTSTGAFDTAIKTGLTAHKRLSWTMFMGHLVLSNGVDTMFKYGYLPQPLNPATNFSSGGSKGSRTYYVTVTYKSANGETVASAEAEQAIGSSELLTVTSPVSLPGATHYNVYHHTVSGDTKLQNSSPITIGTDYTETSGDLIDGASPPTTNTAWYCVDLVGSPPKAKYVFGLNSRVWASGIPNNNTRFMGSAVANDDDWTTSSDAVDIDLAGSLARGDMIRGVNRLGQSGSLILGLRNHIVTYNVPAVFNDISIDKIVYNNGVMSHQTMDEVGVDNYILETSGLNSLKNEIIVQGLKTKKLSDNIKDRLVPLLEAIADQDEVNSINYKAENEFIINIPSLSRRFVYDYALKAWMEDRDVKVNAMVSTPLDELLSAGENGRVYREYKTAGGGDVWADGNNNKPISFRWDTPWLWMDSIQTKKLFKYFRFKGSGGGGLFDLNVFYDFSDTSYKTHYLQSIGSNYGDVEWDSSYWNFPDINKVLVPMIGMGKAVKFSFTSNLKNDMKIAFYGVSFIPSGMRAND